MVFARRTDVYKRQKQSCAGYVAEQGKLERELGEIIENEESIRMELEVSENLEKELNLRIEELHALLEKERDTESEQLKISDCLLYTSINRVRNFVAIF